MKWYDDIKEELTIVSIFILGIAIIFSDITNKGIILGTLVGGLIGVLKGEKKNSRGGNSDKISGPDKPDSS